jgi:hypothetical protein
MLSKAALGVALSAPVTFVLQGCGGGGTTTPAPAPPTTPGPTTTTVAPTTTTRTTTTFTARTPGWTEEEAVQQLNEMYMGFDPSNDTSPLGVTISFAGNPNSFHENIFCEGYAPDETHCFGGNADCGLSGAVINHHVLTTPYGNGTKVASLMDRSVGYIFNQTLTETYWAKCAYLYDGANTLNVNSRCGSTAHGTADCDDHHSAFYNQCTRDEPPTPTSSYHTCARDDPEVANMLCAPYGPLTPPLHKSDQVCMYEMPALIVPEDGAKSFVPSKTSHLREAMNARFHSDQQSRQFQEWNEIVLDEKLVIPHFHHDPTHTILAFVYVAGGQLSTESAQTYATQIRDDYESIYRVHGVPHIPIVELNSIDDFTQTGGPFRKAAPPQRVVV